MSSPKINEAREIPWPYNLIEELGGEYTQVKLCTGWEGQMDFTASAMQQMVADNLRPRECEALMMYYSHSVTYQDVGAMIGVSGARVQQIVAKAKRKLYRYVPDYASVPYREWETEHGKRIAAERQLEEVQTKLDRLTDKIADKLGEASKAAEDDTMQAGIETLELSVRSFNCLGRAGILTVGQLLDMPSPLMFRSVRNLGRKSAEEIIAKVHEKGLRFAWET